MALRGGPASAEFFFGNVFKIKPPPLELFAEFKYVLQLVGLPLAFVAGAVALKGISGVAAFRAALTSAATNWLPLLLFGAFAMAFEWLAVTLPTHLPKAVAVPGSICLLLLFVALSLALTYTISARALNTHAHASVG